MHVYYSIPIDLICQFPREQISINDVTPERLSKLPRTESVPLLPPSKPTSCLPLPPSSQNQPTHQNPTTPFMRIPSLLIRTLYAVSNVTTLTRFLPNQPQALQPLLNRAAAFRNQSMPIPLLSSLFSSAPSRNMSHPVQKSRDEWRAQLSPGNSLKPPFTFPPPRPQKRMQIQLTAAEKTYCRTIPRPPRKRHRSPLHGRIRPALPRRQRPRRLHLRRLRRPAVQGQPQVQERVRVAGVLRCDSGGGDEARG